MSTTSSHHPIVDEPVPQPTRWGEPELARLSAMLRQGSLFYWNGPQTTALLEGFRRQYPFKYCFPCSSGTASLHIAVLALRLKPGDEVIVPPVTDMGTVIGILYQQAVPVFADLDPDTYNLDPADVRRRVTSKTRAIITVHLTGNPSDLAGFSAVAKEHKLALVEDCAQAWGARWQGRPIGTIGDFGCYSLNDFKHIGCGDGGITATNDERMGPSLGLWGDKGYDRVARTREPVDLAPNYRMSEPQAAVSAAQMERLPDIAARRNHAGEFLTSLLAGTPGFRPPVVAPGNMHSYWFYMGRLELARFATSRTEIVAALQAEGVAATAGYIDHPLYRYPLFRDFRFFGGTWPLRDAGLTAMDYREVRCPATEAMIDDWLALRPFNEAMPDAYLEKVAKAVRTVLKRLAR